MRKKIYTLLLAAASLAACQKNFLERSPVDRMEDDTYWTNEKNVRTFAWGFYTDYFSGYGSGFTWGRYFSGQALNDDFAPTSPGQFIRNIPATDAGWSFSNVRRANLMIDRINRVQMDDAAKKHWSGIGRFFRALEYANLVKKYGDMPWYDKVLTETDAELYRARDTRVFVMDKVLEDFKFAAENVRVSDGEAGLTVNKYVVLGFMSRIFLFQGTWLKYHNVDQNKAQEYLQDARWAADEVIKSGKYALGPDYRKVFSSLDLTGHPEMLLFRRYEAGLITHTLNSYNNREPQSGPSKNAIESYLCSDGLPISISPRYAGDKSITNVMSNRDPRLTATFVPALRLDGYVSNYSSSGYATWKFLNEEIKDLPEGSSNLNPTDAPVIRYGEILINYAEATAELGLLTQSELDKSVNVLRKRTAINMPALQVIGNQPAVNGTAYDDPKRDPTVSPILWEIRRERRIELMMEGFRLDDLRRWKKLAYTDTKANPDINKGVWIRKADYPNLKTAIIENNAPEGYIIPAWKAESQRLFEDPKVYLDPLPLDQIKLYSDQGKQLLQNPGW
ncbi:RagB/SusD family nutrient uptake outer membrane protein [Chitinophaga pendula]|uniref:RagB/SusD family nutrient uptake outer membrane protein n=1 Tax=Chitinophaga TaxID=79328 RepID=UPI000BB052FD|nr:MULTISPECIES: RagB/SusD family nutrient uptake outer membrane protein [Chitinophaga]ASZ11797.1 RagB/SusD family nutrient uptake outer membrane protein [Chitinophaga sp. MD30]UCJ05183.1 RagB/SusD family nutrient uptake outer membrane protein [Chitinophaga pendula]